MVRLRWIIAAAGVLIVAAGGVAMASGARPWRSAPHVAYPADPSDTPPPSVPFDVSTLARPTCPLASPAWRGGDDEGGTDKLVEWSAVRLVVCMYPGDQPLATMTDTTQPAAVATASALLRRMISPRTSGEYFGRGHRDGLTLTGGSPAHRFLFQYPDGRVIEVTHHGSYYRGDTVRHPFSVRGSDLDGLYPTGSVCVGPQRTADLSGPPCTVTGATAAMP
ncbi:hypothetical protein [Longispora urticae]